MNEQALAQYRERARKYDRSFSILLAGPVRRRAVRRIAARAGETVLDVACGTGLNLPELHAGVGSSGSLVGVEMSPEMLRLAKGRVEARGWTNVELIESAAEDLQLIQAADAALLSFTHDVLRSEAAVARVADALRTGGRAVAAGVMYPWLAAGRPLVRAAARSYVTTFDGLDRPWSLLAEQLEIESVERLRPYAGSMYVVTARKRA